MLAFEIGNEVAFQIEISTAVPSSLKEVRKAAWFTLLSELSRIVPEEEGPKSRPVSSAFADLFELGVPGVSDDASLVDLDFLSCNVFRGTTIRRFVADVRADRPDGNLGTTKPLFISEMGVDAYCTEAGAERFAPW